MDVEGQRGGGHTGLIGFVGHDALFYGDDRVGEGSGDGGAGLMGCGAGGAASFDDGADMLLDVAAVTGPFFLGAAKGSDVVEVVMLGGDAVKIIAVVEFALVAGAVDEPDVLAVAAIFPGMFASFGEKPLRKSAHGGDSGAGGDEDGVGEWLAEGEVAVGTVDLDLATYG